MSEINVQLIRHINGLTTYVDKERKNLDKMEQNPNVAPSLFAYKVEQFNGLLQSLNGLIAHMLGSEGGPMFELYGFVDEDVSEESVVTPPVKDYEAVSLQKTVENVSSESKARADQVLTDYQSNVEQDIAETDPEIIEAEDVLSPVDYDTYKSIPVVPLVRAKYIVGSKPAPDAQPLDEEEGDVLPPVESSSEPNDDAVVEDTPDAPAEVINLATNVTRDASSFDSDPMDVSRYANFTDI